MGLDLRGLGGEPKQCWLSLSSTSCQPSLMHPGYSPALLVWGLRGKVPLFGYGGPRVNASQHPQGCQHLLCGVAPVQDMGPKSVAGVTVPVHAQHSTA